MDASTPSCEPGDVGPPSGSPCDILPRPTDPPQEEVPSGRCSFCGYFVLCFLGSGSVAAACVYFWSFLGCQEACLNALQKLSVQGYLCFACTLAVAVLLYLLDFFWPDKDDGDPRGGEYCVLWKGDRCFGACVIVMLGVFSAAGCYMMSESYAWAPLVLTTFLCPIVLSAIRLATRPPEHYFDGTDEADATDLDFAEKIRILRIKVFLEEDTKNFYNAARIVLVVVSLACIGAWVAEGDLTSDLDNVQLAADHTEQEKRFIIWVAPGVVALTNLVFAILVSLRLTCAKMYTGTDKFRNKLLVACGDGSSFELKDNKNFLMKARLTTFFTESARDSASFLAMDKDKQDAYIAMHIKYEGMITFIIQCMGCSLLVVLGCNFMAYQLATTHKSILQMFFAIVTLLFLFFACFIFASFRRIWRAIGTAVLDMPLFKTARGLFRSDWFRAAVFFWLGPIIPLFLVVSIVNQIVRKYRLSTGRTHGENQISSLDSLLTRRVRLFVAEAAQYDRISILRKTYVFALCMVIYVLTPLGLNVLLAWMIDLLGKMHFLAILGAVWASGLVLFLLPPVPGAPVYLFGGVLISGRGVEEWGDPGGFWMGSFICIGVCFVLKLSACAMQQKGIGEYLGNQPWVRQTVGVHRPFIRAIEAILRKPGLSFGKVVILVGGPDWPTSVLAGVLKLSLVQCLLGTTPIITYIAPLSLTGSFYYKRAESDTWQNLGDLMFTITGIMTIVYWALIGWAVQNTYEKDFEELSRPLEKYIDLEWLDHRQQEIARMVVVEWKNVPCVIKWLFAGGCISEVVCAQAFYWMSRQCFSEFQVTDDISQISLYGKVDSLVKPYGIVGLCVFMMGLIGPVTFESWRSTFTKAMRAEAMESVDKDEERWKQQRTDEARKWKPRGQQPECAPANEPDLLQ